MNEEVLSIQNIHKAFGDTVVLRGIDLKLQRGEFFTLLGSSGCGKTTTLRILAGLEQPDSGRVYLEGHDITNTAPNHRNINTVFQSYALFPHLNLYQNIAYGLKLQKKSKAEIDTRVREVLELVQLNDLAARMPNEISGGQRQRVAMARAIANRPQVLLLDEPLGALDLKLRKQMQAELKRLQEQLGITFVYVTHDQEEALNMSDRIGVMRDGEFEQIGTPREIYDRPHTPYVADFVGETNLLTATVRSRTPGGLYALDTAGGHIGVRSERPLDEGDELQLSVRPGQIRYRRLDRVEEVPLFDLTGRVAYRHFMGAVIQTGIQLGDGPLLTVNELSDQGEHYPVGAPVRVYWRPEDSVIVRRITGLPVVAVPGVPDDIAVEAV